MQRKEGLIHVLTGDGNGKTTSAVGVAARAAGRGLKVAFVQFLKGGFSGELEPLRMLGVTVVTKTKHCPNATEHEESLKEKGFVAFDEGCFKINEIDKLLVSKAFERANEFASFGEYGLVVLDEVFIAIRENLLSEQEVIGLLKGKAPACEIILTGRGATLKIQEMADYVTFVEKRKHPFDLGVLSRSGIDY